MSTTITVGRRVAATRTSQGIVYAMFEKTYESNVFPQTPHWGCYRIGTIAECLEKAFGMASSCEGGMVARPGGRLTPEGYLTTWMREFANPRVFREAQYQVRCGDGYRSAFQEGRKDEVAAKLAALGFAEAAAAMASDGVVRLRMPRDALLAQALTRDLRASCWTVLPQEAAPEDHAAVDPALGHAPGPGRQTQEPAPMALKMGFHGGCLVRGDDGRWRPDHAPVQHYVAGLWREELANPGGHARKIKAYRAAVLAAPPAPTGTAVRVTSGLGESDHVARDIAELRTRAEVAPDTDVFEIAVSDRMAYYAADLPDANAEWLVPATDVAQRATQPALAL